MWSERMAGPKLRARRLDRAVKRRYSLLKNSGKLSNNSPIGIGSSVAIFVSMLGIIGSIISYIITYYKDIEFQEKKFTHEKIIQYREQQNKIILSLLRENPNESANNLLWAANLNLINLDKAAEAKLKVNPLSTPVSQGVTSNSPTWPGMADPRILAWSENSVNTFKKGINSEDLEELLSGLDAPRKSDRSIAMKILIDDYLRNGNSVATAAEFLVGKKLDNLSANGRYNILYYLNSVDWSVIEKSAREKVNNRIISIENRNKNGKVSIGPKTQELIDGIKNDIGG